MRGIILRIASHAERAAVHVRRYVDRRVQIMASDVVTPDSLAEMMGSMLPFAMSSSFRTLVSMAGPARSSSAYVTVGTITMSYGPAKSESQNPCVRDNQATPPEPSSLSPHCDESNSMKT